MNRIVLAACMNEWMRRYTEDPSGFAAEFQTVGEFCREKAAGEEPSYGQWAAEYIERIAADLTPAGSGS